MAVPEKTALAVLRRLEQDGLAEENEAGWRLAN
jgi:hypothetical protein